MFEWKSVCLTLGLIALCFVGIPIKMDNFKSNEQKLNFESYLELYNKSYKEESKEYHLRFKHFQESKKHWKELNKNRNSSDLANYGYTEFADISQEEFSLKYLTHHRHRHRNKSNETSANVKIPLLKFMSPDILPNKVDWRERGVVTKIKNQGLCGACWAFSIVSVAETMSALKTGQLQDLSVQEMIDCAGNGNLGCNGGDTCSLIEWLVFNKINIETEKEYPLVLKNEICKLKKTTNGVNISPNYYCQSFVNIEKNLLKIIANHGPVTVAVNAITWQYYLGGIIRFNCDNSIQNLNHAVVIVGYDLTGKIPYYIVRNSWGTKFGENGYLKIAIGENVCGIAHEVTVFDVV